MRELHLLERVQAVLSQDRALGAYGTEAGPQGGGNTAFPPKEHRARDLRRAADARGRVASVLERPGQSLPNDMLEAPSPFLARKLDQKKARRRNHPDRLQADALSPGCLYGPDQHGAGGAFPMHVNRQALTNAQWRKSSYSNAAGGDSRRGCRRHPAHRPREGQ